MTRQDEFLARHPEWRHVDVPFGAAQERRMRDVWTAILDSQNGRDVDTCHPGAMTNFLINNGLRGPGKMLIVGCGTGEEVAEARALGWDARGTTLGPMNVACAKESGIDGVSFEDFHTSSFETASFDAVVGKQIWEHSLAPFLFAIECARVLKPGGRVVLETPDSFHHIYESHVIHHVLCPTPHQGTKMLEKAGFVDVSCTANGRPFANGDEHRDDVGEAAIVFSGRRWSDGERPRVHPLVQSLTGGAGGVGGRSSGTRERQIEMLYLELLGRAPDPDGFRHYTASPSSIDEIRSALASSDEARKHREAARVAECPTAFGDRIDWDNEANRAAIAEQPDSEPGPLLLNVMAAVEGGGRTIVDCGCNIARFYGQFRDVGFKYVGIDQAAGAIATAKARYPEVTFEHCFLWEDWPAKFAPFDVALCNAVLQHNTHDEKRKILPRIAAAVRRGGLFVMQESTTPEDTATQLRHSEWVRLVEGFGFVLLKTWNENVFGIADAYLFRRV